MSNDGSFVTHQYGAISSTFTSDWYLRKGESRDKMGEWLKKATVRSQDHRRMLQANTHSFPSNYWRNKITKGKESNNCDLCRALWTAEGRVNTEDELPIQTLGHIQHQCQALSDYIHSHTIGVGVSFMQNWAASHPLNGDSSALTGKNPQKPYGMNWRPNFRQSSIIVQCNSWKTRPQRR